jgi:hypothetical protein
MPAHPIRQKTLLQYTVKLSNTQNCIVTGTFIFYVFHVHTAYIYTVSVMNNYMTYFEQKPAFHPQQRVH